MEKTFREVAEMHYSNEPVHKADAKYREIRINALSKLWEYPQAAAALHWVIWLTMIGVSSIVMFA